MLARGVDVEKTIEFLLGNQAKHDERLSELEKMTSSLARSVANLADNVKRLDETMVTLAESEVRTNERIDQLGTRVEQFVGAMAAFLRHLPPQPSVG